MALVSAIVNFAFIAAFPFWAITMITLDVLVIYAIAAHGRELPEPPDTPSWGRTSRGILRRGAPFDCAV